ncbi:hypothetical protein SRABI02_03605 [Plantibacter cousiniae]|nr:hypothetical protein SRABI02_03605 [Plantibacter cousiniae]
MRFGCGFSGCGRRGGCVRSDDPVRLGRQRRDRQRHTRGVWWHERCQVEVGPQYRQPTEESEEGRRVVRRRRTARDDVHVGRIAQGASDGPEQCRTSTDLDVDIDVGCGRRLDRLAEPHRGEDVLLELTAQLLARLHRAARHGGDELDLRRARSESRQVRHEGRPDRLEQGRVEPGGDAQRVCRHPVLDAPFRDGAQGLAGSTHHRLPGVVGGCDPRVVDTTEERCGPLGVAAKGRHAVAGSRRSRPHVVSADRGEPYGVGRIERARRRQGGQLADTVPDDEVGLHADLAQQRHGGDRRHRERGLADLGGRETVDSGGGVGIGRDERREHIDPGLVEHLLVQGLGRCAEGGEPIEEVRLHPRCLAALPGEDEGDPPGGLVDTDPGADVRGDRPGGSASELLHGGRQPGDQLGGGAAHHRQTGARERPGAQGPCEAGDGRRVGGLEDGEDRTEVLAEQRGVGGREHEQVRERFVGRSPGGTPTDSTCSRRR